MYFWPTLYVDCAVPRCVCVCVCVCVDDETSVTTALEETQLEVVDMSACVSPHNELVKSAKFRQHG